MSTDDGHRFHRFVAMGDSFTEGVGDELPDGRLRGWADLVAGQVADSYANLAVRGKLLGPIIDEQLDAGLALRPDLASFSGGGNDVLRPRMKIDTLRRLLDLAVARLVDTGATALMFTGADPADHLPLGGVIRSHGDEFAVVARQIADRRGALLVDLWAAPELRDLRYWSADRLHLNADGHRQVAIRVLQRLGFPAPADWSAPVAPVPASGTPKRDQLPLPRARRAVGAPPTDRHLLRRPPATQTASTLRALNLWRSRRS